MARRAGVSDQYFCMCIWQVKNWGGECSTFYWEKNPLSFDFCIFFNMFSLKTCIYINHSQDETSANQSAMAVSIFVLMKMTRMFASVMRVFC